MKLYSVFGQKLKKLCFSLFLAPKMIFLAQISIWWVLMTSALDFVSILTLISGKVIETMTNFQCIGQNAYFSQFCQFLTKIAFNSGKIPSRNFLVIKSYQHIYKMYPKFLKYQSNKNMMRQQVNLGILVLF